MSFGTRILSRRSTNLSVATCAAVQINSVVFSRVVLVAEGRPRVVQMFLHFYSFSQRVVGSAPVHFIGEYDEI